MLRSLLLALFLCVFCCLSACTEYQASAPVRDIDLDRVGSRVIYRVHPGDTLYSVAWRYDMDYRKLADLNHLKPPYALSPGQTLVISGPSSAQPPQPFAASSKTTYVSYRDLETRKTQSPKGTHSVQAPQKPSPEPSSGTVSRFIKPARGKVVSYFSSQTKGIDIAGKLNEAVRASASGKIVYAGSGIPSYGQLVIIKHNALYLSAYGYNHTLLVKEGQWVKKGQVIARMGRMYNGRPGVHFEIRKAGKPLNPMKLL